MSAPELDLQDGDFLHDDEFERRLTSKETPRNDAPDITNNTVAQKYSMDELIRALGDQSILNDLPPELERRVLDFRLAQQKRRQKYGEQKRWGIFGMYAHLSNVRIDLEWAEDAAWRRSNGIPYYSWTDFDQTRQNTAPQAWFTYFLIFLCTVMMFLVFGLNGWKVESLKTNPLIGPSAEALIAAGARDTSKILEDGQWFRLFSPLVLHAGLVHFAVNMMALWFIGLVIEQNHGVLCTLLLFLVPGVGGNILSALFLSQYISVGASGGIFGLIGGCIADLILNWPILFIKSGEENENEARKRNIWTLIWLIFEIVLNLLIGFTPYVDNFSHLGGLLYGLLCGLSLMEPLSIGFFGVAKTSADKFRHLFVKFFGLGITALAVMATTGWLAGLQPGDRPCSGCRYISCVPFPLFQDEKWWYCDDCDQVEARLIREGDDYFQVDLTCPDKDIVSIDVSERQYSVDQKLDLQRDLPKLCRGFCEDTFGT